MSQPGKLTIARPMLNALRATECTRNGLQHKYRRLIENQLMMEDSERAEEPVVIWVGDQRDTLASRYSPPDQIQTAMLEGFQFNVINNHSALTPINEATIHYTLKEEFIKPKLDSGDEDVIEALSQQLKLSEMMKEKPLVSWPLRREKEKPEYDGIFRDDSKLSYQEGSIQLIAIDARPTQGLKTPVNFSRPLPPRSWDQKKGKLRDEKMSGYPQLAYQEANLPLVTIDAQKLEDLKIIENFRQRFSIDSFTTATSGSKSYMTAPSFLSQDPSKSLSAVMKTRFQALLQRGKMPVTILKDQKLAKKVPPDMENDKHISNELDWCGRGMHVDFQDKETIPLEVLSEGIIGKGSTASVDIVRCRRIKLARKTVMLPPSRKVTERILYEVHALHRLSHSHIIRLVGTYIQKRKFVTLLYPAAAMNLEEFLEEVQQDLLKLGPIEPTHSVHREYLVNSKYCRMLSQGSICLTSALRYLHKSGVNHSDIKPANIVLRDVSTSYQYIQHPDYTGEEYEDFLAEPQKWYKMYFCDFGTSRILDPDGETETEENRGRTPRYASPEVMADNPHGRAADIYSFGYVLAEMATVYSGRLIEDFRNYIQFGKVVNSEEQLSEETRAPFQAYHKSYRIGHIQNWFHYCSNMKVSNQIISQMIHEDPTKRPRLLSIATEADIIVFDMACEHESEGAPPFEIENED